MRKPAFNTHKKNEHGGLLIDCMDYGELIPYYISVFRNKTYFTRLESSFITSFNLYLARTYLLFPLFDFKGHEA